MNHIYGFWKYKKWFLYIHKGWIIISAMREWLVVDFGSESPPSQQWGVLRWKKSPKRTIISGFVWLKYKIYTNIFRFKFSSSSLRGLCWSLIWYWPDQRPQVSLRRRLESWLVNESKVLVWKINLGLDSGGQGN